MVSMQPCARSLRAAIPNGSRRIAPLLRSRPLSTTRPSLYSADNILLPRIPVDVYDPAADIPKDLYVGATDPYDLLPPGTKILKHFAGNPAHSGRALCDAIQKLQTTPWRIKTEPLSYLERGYVFPTPALAFDFVSSVWDKARRWGHYPLWAGCGRRVYMRWYSKQDDEKGLTARDMVVALACDGVAAKLVGAAGVVGSDRGWEGPDREFWADIMPVAPFYPKQRQLTKQMKNSSVIRTWIKNTAFVPKVVASEDHHPVWSFVHGAACVSQTYWRVVDGPDDITLVLPSEDLGTVKLDGRVLTKDSSQSRLLLTLLHRVAPRNKEIGGVYIPLARPVASAKGV